METGQKATPIFVIAGGCPNTFSPMQAVVYCRLPTGVDFWWLKPKANNMNELEENTLHRHANGPHKNDPGKSRNVYQPLADKFEGKTDGDFFFGVDDRGRAYIEDLDPSNTTKQRMLVYFIWMESWSSPLARRRFVQG